MQFKTNKSLYDLISALAGTDNFTSTERSFLLSMANRRFYEAYQTSDIWPRYMAVGEPRTITSSVISYTEDSRWVFNAGTTAINGLYVANGTQASARAYTLYDTDGTTALYSIIYNSGTTWNIIAGAPSSGGAVQYANADAGNTATAASPTISETGWTVSNGTSPAPSVRDLGEIAHFTRIHRLQPFLRNSTIEFDFFADADGAHVENLVPTDTTTVYVTYKKLLTELTTLDYDGSLGTNLVPIEFFYFMGHATYADFLRMDGQLEKAMTEEKIAKSYLDTELEKAESVANINALNTRINTHLNRQSR